MLRLLLWAALILLTRPDGGRIWIAPSQVVHVTDAIQGEHFAGNRNTEIQTTTGIVTVREPPGEVVSKIREAK